MKSRFTRQHRWIHLLTAVVLGAMAALWFAPARSASAHSLHDHKIYVAPTGHDTGTCDQLSQPCRTIRYAINQANSQGSEVRVARGEYFFDPQEITLLTSQQVLVRGGYSQQDGFTTSDLVRNPTYLAGIPVRYREQLLAQGFGRIEDREGRENNADIMPGAAELNIISEQATPTSQQDCVAGMAGIFPCRGIDFLGSVALNQFVAGGMTATASSNLWGHVDLNTGREYALIGVDVGTGVVDVTDPVNPVVIGTVPGIRSIWREVKVYQFFNSEQKRWNAYAYISSEAAGQGLQVIDLNRLGDATPSVALATTITSDFDRSHTVYVKNVNYTTNTALTDKTAILYMNGTNRTSGVFRAFSLTNPAAPALIGPPATNTRYTHDSTSVIITDGRTSQCAAGHNPCEVLFDFNGSFSPTQNRLNIWDVTDPANPVRISSTPYPGSGYTHSGWYSDDARYLFIQDEIDEQTFGHNTRVRTLDISNLQAPFVSTTWNGPTAAIDHNGYMVGTSYYMSNYRRGLTILDATNPNALRERSFFDTFPGSDSAEFSGAWGVYPFLASGNLLISDIQRGLIIVRESQKPTTTIWLPLLLGWLQQQQSTAGQVVTPPALARR